GPTRSTASTPPRRSAATRSRGTGARAVSADWRPTLTCDHRNYRRRLTRAQATRGHGYARPGRPVRTGWYAHRCGVSRCGQVFVPVETAQEITWRGRG